MRIRGRLLLIQKRPVTTTKETCNWLCVSGAGENHRDVACRLVVAAGTHSFFFSPTVANEPPPPEECFIMFLRKPSRRCSPTWRRCRHTFFPLKNVSSLVALTMVIVDSGTDFWEWAAARRGAVSSPAGATSHDPSASWAQRSRHSRPAAKAIIPEKSVSWYISYVTSLYRGLLRSS